MESQVYKWTYWILIFLICPIWWKSVDDLRLDWAKKDNVSDDSEKGILLDNNDYNDYQTIQL